MLSSLQLQYTQTHMLVPLQCSHDWAAKPGAGCLDLIVREPDETLCGRSCLSLWSENTRKVRRIGYSRCHLMPFSLSRMDTTCSSTAENARAQTLRDARISCDVLLRVQTQARTFHKGVGTTQPQFTRQARGSGGARL